MTAMHVLSSELELFVMGEIPARRAAAIEEHVTACDACARALEREARLEVALEELAAAAPRAARDRRRVPPVRARRLALAGAAAGTLCFAAGWAVWLASSGAAAGSFAPPASAPAARAHVADDAATARLDAYAFDSFDGG